MNEVENIKTHKQCARCKKWILRIKYHVNKQNNDGLHSYCPVCRADIKRAYFPGYYKKNIEKIAAKNRANYKQRIKGE